VHHSENLPLEVSKEPYQEKNNEQSLDLSGKNLL